MTALIFSKKFTFKKLNTNKLELLQRWRRFSND